LNCIGYILFWYFGRLDKEWHHTSTIKVFIKQKLLEEALVGSRALLAAAQKCIIAEVRVSNVVSVTKYGVR
jgi:hypothetical protein